MKMVKFFASGAALLLVLSCSSGPKNVESAPSVDCHSSSRLPNSDLLCANVVEANEFKIELDPALVNLRAFYQANEQKLYWMSSVEDLFDFSQFYRRKYIEAHKTSGQKKHLTEIWGIENYKAFVRARDFLNDIPQGQFKMSVDLIKKTHGLSAEGLEKATTALGKVVSPMAPSLSFSAGSFKTSNNRGGDPLKNPLTEEQYANLKANPYVKFRELPWPLSREGRRRGWILYQDYRLVEKSMQELCDWVNQNMGKMDPIKLAAEFQWRFVSIHPMADGNGRTSMLFANRILMENDLPPIMGTYKSYELYFSKEQWAAEVRESIFEFENVMKDASTREMLDKETPNFYKSNFVDGPKTGLIPESARTVGKKAELDKLKGKFFESWRNIHTELYTSAEAQEVPIGRQRFIAMLDGFFYDKYGIPHQLHNGKLYPIADHSMTLYSDGGALKEGRFSKRSLNPFHRDQFKQFFKFMGDLKKDKTIADNVEVLPYSHIQKANESARDLYLYDWQIPLFESVIKITDIDPAAVLVRTRGYSTSFEQAFHHGYKTNLHDTLAQYLLVDLKFRQYAQFAKQKGREDWLQEIDKSRDKLFVAAKTLIEEPLKKLVQVAKANPEKMATASEWLLLNDYYEASPLKFATRQEALAELGDDKIVLLRSDQSFIVETYGFVTNSGFVKAASRIPGYSLFKNMVERYNVLLTEKKNKDQAREQLKNEKIYQQVKSAIPGADQMIRNLGELLVTSPYQNRGVAEEYDRFFVQHSLHSINTPLKENVSFSLSTANYIRTKINEETGEADGRIPFSFDSSYGVLYFVSMSKDDIMVNLASKYFRQFEILSEGSVFRPKIVGRYNSDYFNKGVNPVKGFKESKEIRDMQIVETQK